jgi:hypothetical protein
VRHHAAVGLRHAVVGDPLATLVAFRFAASAACGARREALFDLLDPVLTAEPVVAPVHLSTCA